MSRLTFEIGAEAIPADYVAPALAALQARAEAGLRELRLSADRVAARGTPFRLVLEVEGLAARQEDLEREVQGPRVDIAFKDGQPTPAAIGFAKKNGVEPGALERVATDRGEFVMARVFVEGRPAADVLPELLSELVGNLPWPKTMHWTPDGFLFPRPIRWLLCLLDDRVLPVAAAGLTAGRETRGHRLLGPGAHAVPGAGALEGALEKAGVILDPASRRERIGKELAAAARKLGGRVVADPALLDEVVFLAEHPTVHAGSFDVAYLEMPREVIVTAMRSHQRYFAVEDEAGRLRPHFLVVCDGSWEDPSQVIAGNERVLRARLADARFYWDVDLGRGLDALAEQLGKVVWLEAVGSLRDKAERTARLVDLLGRNWFPGRWADERDRALRAARLAKADLVSEMIKDGKEFTGLQGVIGARYAEALKEDEAVSRALAEQYLPRGPEDPLPASQAGLLLAVADRTDTLAGCWAAGFVPSGSQDPYALRRAGNGIVRMLLEKELHLSLRDLVAAAVEGLPPAVRREGLVDEIASFLGERTAWFLRERGIRYDVVDAVLAADMDDPLDALSRARALQSVREEKELEGLVVGFKRAANILKGVDAEALPDPGSVDWAATEPAERGLHAAATEAASALAGLRARREYAAMLRRLIELRPAIDGFFDGVLVMAEDPGVRGRRLALLAEVRRLFDHLCDLSRIVLEGES